MHSTTVIPLFVIAFVIIVSIVHQSVVAVDMMGSTEMSSSTMMTTKPSVMSSTSTTTIMSTSSTAMPTETPMMASKIGDKCDNNDHCSKLENAECKMFKCMCKSGYKEDKMKCMHNNGAMMVISASCLTLVMIVKIIL